MNSLSNFLVEQILLEDKSPIKDVVVVYVGRFQPMHKGHYAVYDHLTKKFGKKNVFVGTSDKVEKGRSPFTFKEKQEIMHTMFGIPKNRIVNVKNPYAPTEVLKNYNENTTAFVTVVGEKDKSRLGGKYFQKWDGEPTEGYKDKGYVYVAPSFGGGISGTETRNGLSLGSEEQKKDFFKNRVYGKYNEKIFRMITDKLNESFVIRKETIEDWLLKEHNHINTTLGVTDGGDMDVDDGPNSFFPNFEVFNRVNVNRAIKIGYEVLQKIMDDVIEDYPIYPNGPVDSVTFYPAGVVGKLTTTNQIEYYDHEAYDEWYKHARRVAGQAGYQLVQTELEKLHGKEDKEQSGDDAVDLIQHIDENINIPVKVGDTILTGRFKNKKVVVKQIGKDDHGMPTINGKKVVNFRLVKEGFIAEMSGTSVDCQKCDHSWEIEGDDPHPYLCHNCGYDNQKMEYDYDDWNKWKREQGIKEEKRIQFYENHFRNLTPSDFKLLKEGNSIKITIPSKLTEKINTEDVGGEPYVVDLEDLTTDNENFRTTKWTGKQLQMTLMSVDDEIGLEVHETGDQFIRVESGEGKVVMGKDKDNLDFQKEIEEDDAIFIPEGYYHNIINTGDEPLKLYAIYAPVEHPRGRVDVNKPTTENINEVSSNGGYRADAGEPDPVFVTNGQVRKLGANKGRPEYWYENGGYTQLHFPKGDYPFGKGKDKDKLSQQRTVKYKVKNVVKSTLPPPEPDNEGVEKIYETIKKVGNKYVVYPKGGGDRLGTHDTLQAAKKQLSAIEISKHKNESLFGGDGGMKPHDKMLMAGVVRFMQNKLGFSGKVTVKKKSSSSLFGDISLSDAASRGKFTVHYNPNYSYQGIIKNLIHELIHAKQISKGELKPSSDYKELLWKGKPFISVKDYSNFQRKDINQYKKLPWEKEAYEGMDKYYRMFLNSSEFKELVGKDSNLDYILSNLNEVGIGTGQSGIRMGYPDKDQLKQRMKDVEDQRKRTDSNKEFQYEPINEGQLEDLGITDFKSLFKKLPPELQKRVYNLKNTQQRTDKHLEGNVLKHTITVVNRSLKDDDIDIAIAAMFHDIGKDETMGIHPKKGHITHFGHEKVSASLVSKYKNWIQSVGGNPANVLYIVKNHMRYKELSNMRPGKQQKLKSFRAFDKLDKFSKHDRGGLGEGILTESGKEVNMDEIWQVSHINTRNGRDIMKKHGDKYLVILFYYKGGSYKRSILLQSIKTKKFIEIKDGFFDIYFEKFIKSKRFSNKSSYTIPEPDVVAESIITEGGAYGHMSHPFDTDLNLTFGDLKDIANRALDGTLELTTEKTDGQALAISWRDDKGLIAARNKGHLKNRGEAALDINGVSSKFQGRGGLSDAYNYAMSDLNKAVRSLSPKQREKIFQNGGSFMNLEVIYPTSVNVIPYGQPLLIFHGTMQYNEDGVAVGENKEAARILAGMIKQVNQHVQDNYTIQGPPVVQLPKSQTLSSKKGKYLSQIQKLQSEFGLKDTDGVGEYHQAWWSQWVDKNSPTTLDNKIKMGLVKRWAFGDKSFRLDKNNIPDEKVLEWAQKHEKDNHQKIAKDNLRKFEDIFLGLGAEVLEFTSSILTVNPDKAIRDMKSRLDQTAKDVRKSGDPKKIAKLKLELERLNAIGGPSKIVPIEGIVFQYKGKTMKLTGSFASLNQILGIFYG